MGQYIEHACSWLIELAKLMEEGITDGPDGRLQLKFSPCLFITLYPALVCQSLTPWAKMQVQALHQGNW